MDEKWNKKIQIIKEKTNMSYGIQAYPKYNLIIEKNKFKLI